MTYVNEVRTDGPVYTSNTVESSHSAVSWAAIIGGAFSSVVVTMILVILGSGLGLATISPWSGEGISATTFTVTTAIWLIIVQWLSSGLAGYLTGRLRTKWTNINGDEVFFRDTVHGFLAWAAATIFIAACLTSTMATIAKGGITAVSTVAAGAAAGGAKSAADNNSISANDITSYYVDTLYRAGSTPAIAPDAPAPAPAENAENGDVPPAPLASVANARDDKAGLPVPPKPRPNARNQKDVNMETTRILASGVKDGALSPEDHAYLSSLVAERANIALPEAEKRVDNVITKINDAKEEAKEAADKARKIGATFSVLTVASLLIGAFIASAAAAIGGRHRDLY